MPTNEQIRTIDTDYIRKQFPSLNTDWILMDNAGGSQTAKTVIDRINEFYLTSDVQVGGSYEASNLATERVMKAQESMATFINAADPCEVILGSSTSLLLRILALCLRHKFSEGDEVIVTNVDHEANIAPWVDLQNYGINVKFWNINTDTFELNLGDLESLFTGRTRLVAVNNVSNITGTINPIKKIAEFVHDRGALICVDGVAAAPHRPVDVQQLNVDFYAFSFYKVFGPHYSLLYGKKDILLSIPGFNHYFITEPNEVPLKFQPGGVNYELCHSLTGVTDYFAGVSDHHFKGSANSSLREKILNTYSLIESHEENLSNRLLQYFINKSNIKVIGHPYGDKAVRVPTISFIVDGTDSKEIVSKVDEYKIGIRYGDFYARRLIEYLGTAEQNGVIRVSMVHYNTTEEIDKLIDVFEKIL